MLGVMMWRNHEIWSYEEFFKAWFFHLGVGVLYKSILVSSIFPKKTLEWIFKMLLDIFS